jgi:outer membrane biosynthesis protein TonB
MHRQSAIFSALFHLAVIAIAFFGLPQFRRPLPALAPPIAIEVVTVADVTNPPKGRKDVPEEKKAEAEKPETRKTPAPAETPKPVEKTPEKPKEPETPPEPKVAAVPKLPEKPPEKKEEPKPEPKATVEPVQPRVKTKPKPKPDPQPKPADMASVLKNVAKLKKDAPAAEKEQAAKPEPRGAPNNIPGKPLTISELDAIRRQIERCWNVPAGAKDAGDMVVEIHVDMNPDRTVYQYKILNEARLRSDTFYRTMAESAVRALLRCGRDTPLQLPPDKYDTWRSFTLSFNPKEMLGG